MNIKKITDYEFVIEKEGNMRVPVKIFTSEKLLKNLEEDQTLKQGMNVATLPGIYKAAIIMPDGHQGYGFPIGGVSAFDVEKGIITPGGIGFDINCGVRLLTVPLMKEQVEPKIKEIIESLFKHIPAGVGSHSKLRLSDDELDKVLVIGAKWAVDNGYGFAEDLDCTEEQGTMKGADAGAVSNRAKARGRDQLGTLGAGNHFLEVQYVDKIFDKDIAKAFGIEKEGQVTVMIHCGSRGLGHQVCSDYIRQMEEANPQIADKLPDRDLIYAPADSLLAKKYFKAMCASANFAWCNRQMIAHWTRQSLHEVLGVSPEDVKQVYDVAHNIAKLEEHEIDGVKRKVYLHRKGATRAFPPGHPEIPEKYRKVGQPIIIPGSMGTSSYILVGTERGMKESFGSTAHGAGRVMSRHEALKRYRGEAVQKELAAQHIYVKAASWKGISEEAPGVYKDIDEVVKVSHEAGIGNLVVRVRPIGVIKG
ncbi:MAG: RtcB family protein [Nanoarchaeota archaeon]|nr:RtcB family protein [Nanoarchaeota archaeon]